MEVILLQKVRNLGDLGETVTVRSGYGRNYLLPRGIALPATKANLEVFEARRAELEAQAKDRQSKAEARAKQLSNKEVVIAMRASDEGKLFGSVGPQEIAEKLTEEVAEVAAKEVTLPDGLIRTIGEYSAVLQLHAEVEVEVNVLVGQLTDLGVNLPPRKADLEAARAAEEAEALAEVVADDTEDEDYEQAEQASGEE